MDPSLRGERPGLVIVEGIMGSGKSTTALRIADRFNTVGVPAIAITEGASPHPIRFDWDEPWNKMPATQLANASTARWKYFADEARASPRIPIVDGQIFHGNLTSLFLLEADLDLMRNYVVEVATAIRPLRPLLIYFHQDDIDRATRVVAEERGEAWVRYQVDWKLGSPYAERRGLSGIQGLIDLYRDYRRVTDHLFDILDIRKISIENSGREWARYDQLINPCLMGLN
jgi:hypothetical protein